VSASSSSPPLERGETRLSLSSSLDEYAAGDFVEMYTSEFEMVMKVGGLEDINEEDDDELDSSGSFSPCPISPDTAEREDRMWSEVAKGITATVEAEELRTSSSMPSPVVEIGSLPSAL
jgi:hypothetical protein